MTAQTSITAYHSLMRSGALSKKCRELVAVYHEHGALADFEVAGYLDWDKSEVSARRGDLMVKDHEGHCTGEGTIVECGTMVNPKTRKEVNVYRLNIELQPAMFTLSEEVTKPFVYDL